MIIAAESSPNPGMLRSIFQAEGAYSLACQMSCLERVRNSSWREKRQRIRLLRRCSLAGSERPMEFSARCLKRATEKWARRPFLEAAFFKVSRMACGEVFLTA